MTSVLVIVILTSLAGTEITLNTNEITVMRDAEKDDGHIVSKDVNCVIHTTDGKFVSVKESCGQIRKMIQEGRK